MLTPDQKGNIAEAAIAAEAIKLGLGVSKPLNEGLRYDLVFDAGPRVLRIQCKWAQRRGEVVLVGCRTNRRAREGFRQTTYSASEIDAIAAYSLDLDRCYLLPVSRIAGHGQIYLRLSPPRNNQRASINMANRFDFRSINWSGLETLEEPRLGAVAQLAERVAGSDEARGSNPLSSISATPPDDTVIGAEEFGRHCGWYSERAAAGEDFLVTRRGKPHVRLGPAVPQLPLDDALAQPTIRPEPSRLRLAGPSTAGQ